MGYEIFKLVITTWWFLGNRDFIYFYLLPLTTNHVLHRFVILISKVPLSPGVDEVGIKKNSWTVNTGNG